jgi:hypothetical protein
MQGEICSNCKRHIHGKPTKFCIQCQLPLCYRCSPKLLCNNDFDRFSSDTKIKISEIDRDVQKKKKNLFVVVDFLVLFTAGIIVWIFLQLFKIKVNFIFFQISALGIALMLIFLAFTKYDPYLFLVQIAPFLHQEHVQMLFSRSSFRCDNCGQYVPIFVFRHRNTYPLKCRVCHKVLCPNCYIDGFCPNHYQSLSEQIKLDINNSNQKFVFVFRCLFAFNCGELFTYIIFLMIFPGI